MVRVRTSGSREQKAILELYEALGSSLDIRLVLERAYPLLLELVPADYGALGTSASGRPEDYEWIVARLPPAFFAAYPEMAAHDFVRKSVTRQLNVVLRDDDMVSRAELEINMMYRRAREVGAPLEQVMAVMLHVDDRWQSGLSLYREERRPFSERERDALQRMTPAIANAVRSCHLFGAARDWGEALEALLDDRVASVLVAPPATEVARTARATTLLETWFEAHERRAGGLPDPLVAVLARAAAGSLAPRAPPSWTRRADGVTLEVSFLPLLGSTGKARWLLRLEELPDALPLPCSLQTLLTQQEQNVTSAVERGWDNRTIADELHIKEQTVKTHLNHIFIKVGVESRTALVVRVADLRHAERRAPTHGQP